MFDIDFDFLKPTLSPKIFFDHFQSGNQHRMNLSKVGRKPFQNQKVPYKEALVTERQVFSIIWCFAQISLQHPIEIVYGNVVFMLFFGFSVVPWVWPWAWPCVVPWVVHWALFLAVSWVVPWPVPWPVHCFVHWVVPCAL